MCARGYALMAVLLLNVYITGTELLALPVTPSEGSPQGVSMSVEAHRVEARSLRLYSWSFNTIHSGCFGSALLRPLHSPS
jgi:hypothetical protein